MSCENVELFDDSYKQLQKTKQVEGLSPSSNGKRNIDIPYDYVRDLFAVVLYYILSFPNPNDVNLLPFKSLKRDLDDMCQCEIECKLNIDKVCYAKKALEYVQDNYSDEEELPEQKRIYELIVFFKSATGTSRQL